MVVTPSLDASQSTGGHLAEQVSGLWAWLKEKVDPALYRPQARPGTTISHLTGRDGDYYILKNPVDTTYCRLSDRDHFLWERMDGGRTVKDLVVAYFLEYGSFAFARVALLVQGLKAGSFLSERPVNVYQHVRSGLEAHRPGQRLARLFQFFLQSRYALQGIDRFVGAVYRWFGRPLFTKPFQLLWLAISAAGLYAFARAVNVGEYGIVTIAGSVQLGVIGLLLANLCAIFLHEMAHALTVKHYGRQVNRGGFMIYFGLPAFFVDTTDIWLEGKRARLAVSWAGPYSGLILGGLASISVLLWPDLALNPLLFQFAFLAYLSVFLNLNPLLEMDGYYLLMDWLEIPMLRRRSLEFVRTGLWQKLRSLEDRRLAKILAAFSRQQRIFAAFGLLSAIWGAYAILLGIYFWEQRLSAALRDLWAGGGSAGRTLLAGSMLALGSLFLLSMGLAVRASVRQLVGAAARRGLFANTWYLAGLFLALAALVTATPAFLGFALLATVLSLLALGGCTLLAWRIASDRAGSRLSRFFGLLALFSLLLLLGKTAGLAAQADLLPSQVVSPLGSTLEATAFLALAAAGLVIFRDTDLGQLGSLEKVLLLLGGLLSYALVFWQASTYQTTKAFPVETVLDISRPLVSLLVLLLLVPALFSFFRTAFGPAWLTLGLALTSLLYIGLLSLPPLLPALLLAASLILHHRAYHQVPLLVPQWQASLDLSDGRRLSRAFAWTLSALHGQFRQMAGERSGRALAERFNNYAVAAGWPISIAQDGVETHVPEDSSLIERGEVYAAALTLYLDLIAGEIGETSTGQALQRAYDRLPWEEREIGAQYLLRNVERAAALGHAFQSTRRDYYGLLRRMPLFATVSDDELDLLLSRLEPERHPAGKVIVHQGERGERFYVIRQGHIEVTQKDETGVTRTVNHLDRGGFFGEVALLRDAPRNATCRATVPTETLSLSRQDFDAIVRHRFSLRDKVDRSLARAELLRRLPLFAELDGLQIQRVAAQLQERKLDVGQVFIRQGELGDTFYIIESGRAEVFVSQDGLERVVAERGPGEYVGEIALLLAVPRTASVRTLEATQLLILGRTEFEQLVAEHLFIGRGLEQESSRRMIHLRRAVPQA